MPAVGRVVRYLFIENTQYYHRIIIEDSYLNPLYLKIDLLADPGVVHVHEVHLSTLLLHQLLGLQILHKQT